MDIQKQIKNYVDKNLLNQDDFEEHYFKAINKNLNFQELKDDIVCNSHGAALVALEQARIGLEMIKLHVLNS